MKYRHIVEAFGSYTVTVEGDGTLLLYRNRTKLLTATEPGRVTWTGALSESDLIEADGGDGPITLKVWPH